MHEEDIGQQVLHIASDLAQLNDGLALHLESSSDCTSQLTDITVKVSTLEKCQAYLHCIDLAEQLRFVCLLQLIMNNIHLYANL